MSDKGTHLVTEERRDKQIIVAYRALVLALKEPDERLRDLKAMEPRSRLRRLGEAGL